MSRGVALAALALLANAAVSQPLSASSATYLCDGGAFLRVAYINPAQGEHYAVVDWAGRLIPLRQVPAASGARYAAIDERDGHRWHTKGGEGLLARLAANDAAVESIVLSGCRALD